MTQPNQVLLSTEPPHTIAVGFDEADKIFANIEHLQEQSHPLVNPNSSHYEMFGEQTILTFEKMFTKEELKAWAKITAWKYRSRIGKKDNPESELKKIQTYEDYWEYLNES